jgi:hypothetical protein
MISEKLKALGNLTIIAIATSLISVFIGFFEGPQTAHYINLVSLVLTIIVSYKLAASLFKDGKEIIGSNLGRLVFLVLGLLIHLMISVTFINICYGYGWEYKDILMVEPPKT